MTKDHNCPNCGTLMMDGWCPRCHPNPQQLGAYKAHMVYKAVSAIVFIVVVLTVFGFVVATCH